MTTALRLVTPSGISIAGFAIARSIRLLDPLVQSLDWSLVVPLIVIHSLDRCGFQYVHDRRQLFGSS